MNCIDTNQLSKMIDIPKFNKMISNTTTVANQFLESYIKEQNDIKEGTNKRNVALQDERYRKTALDKQREMTEKHQSNMNILNREQTFLQQQYNSMKNTEELLKMLTKQNSKLEKDVEHEIHTIEISDRKTFYEDEQNIYIGWWAKQLKTFYWFLILLFISGIMLTNRYSEKSLWGIVLLLIIYPYIANFIFYLIAGLYNLIRNNVKSVYYD